MNKVVLVGLGGALGSVLRYGLGAMVGRLKGSWAFPLETLLVNVAGCLALGVLLGLGESRMVMTGPARAFTFVGLLGGFTTFSAFGGETSQLLRDGQWGPAMLSVALQLVLGIGGVWAGHALARAA